MKTLEAARNLIVKFLESNNFGGQRGEAIREATGDHEFWLGDHEVFFWAWEILGNLCAYISAVMDNLRQRLMFALGMKNEISGKKLEKVQSLAAIRCKTRKL